MYGEERVGGKREEEEREKEEKRKLENENVNGSFEKKVEI